METIAPLWDVNRSEEERIGWLLGTMTLEEKFGWLAGGRLDIDRLGVPGVGVGGEAAHGVQARNDHPGSVAPPEETTSFVQPIGMSATWDPDLLREAGEVTGVEARVLHHRHHGRGLCRWAPTVDLERDPRWGRNEEGYGEDPLLTGEMAGAYVRGMRGDDPYYIRVAATLKHFYANNTEQGRVWKNATVGPRDRWESYLPPFCRVIGQGAEAIMTAYNRINGVPGIMNREVLDILKKEYGLHHAVGDGGAMGLVLTHAHETGSHAETLAAALHAGVDSMSDPPELVREAAREAYELGLITEADIDNAISNLMKTKLRLGVYDAEKRNPYDQVTEDDLCSAKHQAVCGRVSREAMVLLENDGMLPLKKDASVALIGPLADAWFQDWYGGKPPFTVTVKQGLEALLGPVAYADGHDRVTFTADGQPLRLDADGRVVVGDAPEVFIKEDWGEGSYCFRATSTGKYLAIDPEKLFRGESPITASSKAVFSWHINELFRMEDGQLRSRFDTPLCLRDDCLVTRADAADTAIAMQVVEDGAARAAQVARSADQVVLCLGCQPMVNAKEEHDRSTIALPPYQQRLMDAVTAANANTALVLLSNYPYAFQHKARAVLWSATGAQDLGAAVADTLLGANAPAGRLNMTWYRDDTQLPDINDYDIIKGKRTYRYFDGPAQYAFGHGLAYSSFAYGGLQAALDGSAIRVRFAVTNTGSVTSDEVAQVYGAYPASRVRKPGKQLLGFRRLKNVAPGETRQVELVIPVEEFRFYDVISRRLMVEAGRYTIAMGPASDTWAETVQIDLPGETPGLRDLTRRTLAEDFDDYEGIVLTKGVAGLTAAAPAEEAGLLLYRDVDASTLGQGLTCRLWSAGAQIEVLLDGKRIGHWAGDTVDHDEVPHSLMDRKTKAEEPARRRLQVPLFTDVTIPLTLPDDLPERAALTLCLTGDAKLCWFRCKKEHV